MGLTGKNNQINFLRLLLLENTAITETTRLHFFDDDSENVDKVAELKVNIISNLVDGTDNIFTITQSEEYYTPLNITEKNNNDINNMKSRRSSGQKKLLKKQREDPLNNGKRDQNSTERNMHEEKIEINEGTIVSCTHGISSSSSSSSTDFITSSSKGFTPHSNNTGIKKEDNSHDNPGIFRLLLGASAATAAAVGAISLMK